MNEEIYKQHILDHYREPHNKGRLENYTHMQEGKNASCGDTLTLYLDVNENEVVQGVSFEGSGCAISQAAASMLTDRIKGKKIEELRLLTPGDVYTMLGITISPGRTKCALLAYATLVEAIKHQQV
jgi:nitrogen fixation NifU-like protein